MDDSNIMSDKNFDQHLKAALENVEPDYDPTTWAMLERKMDAALVEEQPPAVDAVDKAVYHTLERLEAPYQSAHWNLLTKRMHTQAVRLRRLRIAKIAEAAIFVLLLWNTENYWGTAVLNPAAPKFDPNVPVAQAPSEKTPTQRHQKHAVGTSENSARNGDFLAALQSQLAQPGAPDLLSGDYKGASSVTEILAGLNATAAQAQRRLYAATEPLPFDLVFAPMAVPSRDALLPAAPIKKFAGKSPFYIATSLSANQNRVLVDGSRQRNGGYGAALAGGHRKNKWGVEVGVGYAHTRYTPKQEVAIYTGNPTQGYHGTVLSEVDADMLTVPAKVTRRVARFGKTSVHAVAGMTAHVAAQKNYDLGTVFFQPNTLPPNFLPDPNASHLRPSGKGVLEKGALRDNLYATADAGLRLERPLGGGRYTAFVEPTYRQALGGNGIGTKQEPINTVSIQAGVLTYL